MIHFNISFTVLFTSFKSMDSGNIKPIDTSSIHKICSGQVVLTLAVAVKELVENSLDAEATAIDVTLKNYGIDFIEVSDNGKGVKSTDFQSLTLKHHTSKIADFSDVPFVSTFGFRGEALSSLCALSNLEITTRSEDSNIGTTLIYDHNGQLIKETPTHKQVGTTVTVKNIFSTLPVRHKEFLRNARKEYPKMVHFLMAYCLISLKKRLACYHISDKGRKTTVLQTSNNGNYKDNIAEIFGDKQVKQIVEISQVAPSKDILDEYFLPDSSAELCNSFRLEGYISNCTHGEGRSSSDRQFFYINGRPCDLLKISKLINEVYHSYNKHQYPFVFLNIVLNEGCADVNVTPDKRRIFIPDEKVLLALMKATLLETYGKQSSKVLTAPLNFLPVTNPKDLTTPSQDTMNTSEPVLKRKFQMSCSTDVDKQYPQQRKSQKLCDALDEHPEIPSDFNNIDTFKERSPLTSSCVPAHSVISKVPPLQRNDEDCCKESVTFALTQPTNKDKLLNKTPPKNLSDKKQFNEILGRAGSGNLTSDKSLAGDKVTNFLNKLESLKKLTKKSTRAQVLDKDKSNNESLSPNQDFDMDKSNNVSQSPNLERTPTELERSKDTTPSDNSEVEINESLLDQPLVRNRLYRDIQFDMNIFEKESNSPDNPGNSSEQCEYRKFRSKIAPNENQKAEDELKKEIDKEDFSNMEIVGQFNLGFIISKLRDDLFIIDQHATDEKYNYEMLQSNTVLETQKLLHPQTLELTAASEAILLDNINIFETNGFRFNTDEDGPPGRKVQLVSVPVSQGWSFGKEDVDEIIFMLTDNPIRMVRPSRVNKMFASRACRKSVMVGTALPVAVMKRLVTHMGGLEQPWNCPHGRPTIRHLLNLNLLKK